MNDILYIVIPCYNEEKVLPITHKMFLDELNELIKKEKISADSKIVFVDDGSRDETWKIICDLSEQHGSIEGIQQSRNRGHQNAVLMGMLDSRDKCDICITIDCDGQDDITAIEQMVDKYHEGYEVVYGVRDNRDTDTLFKKYTAQGFYTLLKKMGVDVVYNHADYRLMSKSALDGLSQFKEVNLFLRGLIPLVGFKNTSVYYKRNERLAGESHYPLKKMLALAIDGITSLSTTPLSIITFLGLLISFLSFCFIIWVCIGYFSGNTMSGWASLVSVICLLCGFQLISIGIIGEYIGKIYMEVKGRPRYIISNRTDKNE
jgi:glycosyltransferase involved in cell wall biosynthesis